MKQYEENLYPRWEGLGLPYKGSNLRKLTKLCQLRLIDENILSVKTPEVLIAGCGTGQHSITSAARFKDSLVTAIDLSKSSLAFAVRKSMELGYDNINYYRKDILDVYSLNREFDVVESAGVLHHMENPFEGWEKLKNVTRPNGLMRIGLYSSLARDSINFFRKKIGDTSGIKIRDDIVNLRENLLTSNDSQITDIFKMFDFYTVSQFRDLVLHVQEHQYSIPRIKEELRLLNLEFCGFESDNIISGFRRR